MLIKKTIFVYKKKNVPKEYTYTNSYRYLWGISQSELLINKLKALQHAYATSEMEIDYVIQMIKARKKCELQTWMGNKATYFWYIRCLGLFKRGAK